MCSQCHSSWRLFHLLSQPGQITYYITVHLVSKDTLTTALNKDENPECVAALLQPRGITLWTCVCVSMCTSVCVCHKIYTLAPVPALKSLQTLLHFSIIPSPQMHLLFTLFPPWAAAVPAALAVSNDASPPRDTERKTKSASSRRRMKNLRVRKIAFKTEHFATAEGLGVKVASYLRLCSWASERWQASKVQGC